MADDSLTEFEGEVIKALQSSATVSWTYVDDEVDYGMFLSLLKEIMPPTCSPTERAFLDEIREKFAISNQTLLSRQPMADGEYVTLYQSDFKCNLQELMEGEDE